jgi:hypothetical protein
MSAQTCTLSVTPRRRRCAAILALGLWSATATAAAPSPTTELGASLGWDQSRGDYGTGTSLTTDRTELRLSLAHGGWRIDAGAPLVSFVTPADGSIVVGGRVVQRPRAQQLLLQRRPPASASVRGLGDADLGIGWHAALTDNLGFNLAARAKFDTGAVDEGLGTGTIDARYSVGLAGERGTAFWSVDAAYVMRGESTLVAYRNSADGALVLGFRFGAGWSIEAHGGAGGAEIDGAAGTRAVGVALRFAPNPNWQFSLQAGRGLADGSADRGAGVSLRAVLP